MGQQKKSFFSFIRGFTNVKTKKQRSEHFNSTSKYEIVCCCSVIRIDSTCVRIRNVVVAWVLLYEYIRIFCVGDRNACNWVITIEMNNERKKIFMRNDSVWVITKKNFLFKVHHQRLFLVVTCIILFCIHFTPFHSKYHQKV